MHGANATGRPFRGDHAGIIPDDILYRFGFASGRESHSADDGLLLLDCRITNTVRCLPPPHKPSPSEVQTCNPYLAAELGELPPRALVLALGALAHAAVLKAIRLASAAFPFAHGAEHGITPRLRLLVSYHCSRYNTQTRRLTQPMFHAIFARVRALLPEGRDWPVPLQAGSGIRTVGPGDLSCRLQQCFVMNL
jgi:uracil-DNA glycosylase family 4